LKEEGGEGRRRKIKIKERMLFAGPTGSGWCSTPVDHKSGGKLRPALFFIRQCVLLSIMHLFLFKTTTKKKRERKNTWKLDIGGQTVHHNTPAITSKHQLLLPL